MGKKLFTEFPPVSTSEWEDLIKLDLKGADYEKKLVWQTPEGIPVRPYYREEDIKDIDYLDSLPGEFPFVRGKKRTSNDWLVRQDIVVDDIGEANAKALDALMKGAGSIGFIMKNKKEITAGEISRLLKDICMSSAEVNFCCGKFSVQVLQATDTENNVRGGALSGLRGSVEFDPFGELVTTGNFAEGEQESFKMASEMLGYGKKLPNFTVINVNAAIFHNSGGSAVHELAFALSSAAEYLERLTGMGHTAEEVAEKIRITFATGSNYFMEIAKFRAARYLWSKLLEAWEVNQQTAGKLVIHAVTSRWNKTIYDPYVNMLRSTTESMAAILGGADSLTVEPFDKHFRKQTGVFSERIARNTQLVLKEEAYFDKVADPAAGSYYIESLTSSLIDESWKLFMETDGQGGFSEAFKKGFIQDRIEQAANKRDGYLAGRRDVLLGTNQYPNPSEKIIKNIDTATAFKETVQAKIQLGRPLKPYRGAQPFEELRLKTEQHPSGAPKVFLLTYGNITMSKARAGFSTGFFACAGFEIIDNPGFRSPEEGVTAALKSKAEIVVICSSDEEYPMIVPFVANELKSAIVVVAGNPKESIGQLQEAGVKHFIHLRSNVLETLKQFQAELGIK
ncbi:MAG: methylmalonyl-CoA mutase family protein [Bacteroidales bacterium]